jgi:GMP synthase (glutamine-hydrolysing)
MPVILLPVGRNGKKSVVIRPIMTNDFMTALPYKVPIPFLAETKNMLVNEFDEISNLFVDLTSKPPGTIEYE